MILQHCSINGKMYAMSGSGIQQAGKINVMKIHEFQVYTIEMIIIYICL